MKVFNIAVDFSRAMKSHEWFGGDCRGMSKNTQVSEAECLLQPADRKCLIQLP